MAVAGAAWSRHAEQPSTASRWATWPTLACRAPWPQQPIRRAADRRGWLVCMAFLALGLHA
jgi:hypothetical protein